MFVLGAAGLLATTFRVNLRRELLERYADEPRHFTRAHMKADSR
jgi:hypothetical protein